jgi:2-amino-4-deoxychorismate synthase
MVAADDFTAMLATVAASTGLAVRVRRFDRDLPSGSELLLVGPGPGDPATPSIPGSACCTESPEASSPPVRRFWLSASAARCSRTSGAFRSPLTRSVCERPGERAVHASIKPRMRSTRFHIESILTENGPAILRRMMIELVAEAERVTASTPHTAPPLPSSGGLSLPYGK